MACTGVIILFIHFSLILFYALPDRLHNKVSFFSQLYVFPFFHQNWSLFAPVPDSNYRLIAVCANGHQRDIFTELVSNHQSNRFSGNGALVLAFSNSIHYFEKNTKLQGNINGPVVNDPYFDIIEHEVKNYLHITEKTDCGHLRIILTVNRIKPAAQKIYFK